jgi:F-type H+-transporting ATPase subunit b
MAGEAEAAGAAHEAGSSFPPFDASLFPHQIIWFAVTFVALYLVMSRVVLPNVAAVLATRASTIKNDIEAAAQASANAEAARLAGEKSGADARAKARETVDAMRAQALAEFAIEQAKIEKSISERSAAAEARIAETRATAMAEVPAIAAGLAGDIAARVSGGVVGAR